MTVQRIAGALLLGLCSACSSDAPASAGPLVAPRVVLLGYATPPTSADSARLQQRTGSRVTMYPLINAMTAFTPLPAVTFSTLVPAPGRITDFDALQCSMDIELTLGPAFAATDSAFVSNAGFPDLYISRRHPYLDATVTPANFPFINRLAANANILSAHMYFGCTTVAD